MRKVAVYCGTQNLYLDMLTAAKSLMVNSSVDKIYFIIENNKFPYLLPECIECINVKDQEYFTPGGPNFKNSLTYMVLIRTALSKILPDEDLVLSLDVDTIVDDNIDELWEVDIGNNYVAAVREPKRSTGSFTYINFGVCLLNLKALRESKKDNEVIYCLNHFHYKDNEQDCCNYKFQGRILELDNKYNGTHFCGKITERKIIHYAGIKQWQDGKEIIPYRQMPLQKVISIWKKNREDAQNEQRNSTIG